MMISMRISLLFTNLVLRELLLHGYLALSFSRCLIDTVAETRYCCFNIITTPLISIDSENLQKSSIIIRHITKYLWDDPGDSTGIATIRIDSLPSLSNATELVGWNDVIIDQVDVNLAGEGMQLRVYSPKALYELKIPKLYGDAASVKAVIKPKRLLIKITKKKTSIFSKQTNNLKAWPQPHRKI